MSNAVSALFVLIAVLFVASAIIMGLRAREITKTVGGRVAIVGVYVAALAISYVVVVFGLMVAFNC